MIEEFTYDKKYLHWTPSAIDCYNRNCVCEGCNIKKIMKTPCMMKYVVIKIVEYVGVPPKETELDIEEILDLLDVGLTLKEISERLGVKYSVLTKFTQQNQINGNFYRGGEFQKRCNKKRKKNENENFTK